MSPVAGESACYASFHLKNNNYFLLDSKLTMLIDQQKTALDAFVYSFIDDVDFIGLLSLDAIANLNVLRYVINRRYAVPLSSV